jgi:hypothetical protein
MVWIIGHFIGTNALASKVPFDLAKIKIIKEVNPWSLREFLFRMFFCQI